MIDLSRGVSQPGEVTAFIVQLAATLAMTGVIWLVQLVHYPLFARVGSDTFAAYHGEHTRLIMYLVVPLMVSEAAGAAWTAVERPLFFPTWAAWTGLALVAVLWGSTFLGQMPLHATLSNGFEPLAHATLISGNWIRTAAWTARSALLFFVLARVLRVMRIG